MTLTAKAAMRLTKMRANIFLAFRLGEGFLPSLCFNSIGGQTIAQALNQDFLKNFLGYLPAWLIAGYHCLSGGILPIRFQTANSPASLVWGRGCLVVLGLVVVEHAVDFSVGGDDGE